MPVGTEPEQVMLDGLDEPLLFLGRVGVIKAEVERAAKLAGKAVVQADALGVAHVQVAVGLGREARLDDGRIADDAPLAAGDVGIDDLLDEVARRFGHVGIIYPDLNGASHQKATNIFLIRSRRELIHSAPVRLRERVSAMSVAEGAAGVGGCVAYAMGFIGGPLLVGYLTIEVMGWSTWVGVTLALTVGGMVGWFASMLLLLPIVGVVTLLERKD